MSAKRPCVGATHRVVGVATKHVDVGLQVVGLVLVRHHEQDHKFLVDVLRRRGGVGFVHPKTPRVYMRTGDMVAGGRERS